MAAVGGGEACVVAARGVARSIVDSCEGCPVLVLEVTEKSGVPDVVGEEEELVVFRPSHHFHELLARRRA